MNGLEVDSDPFHMGPAAKASHGKRRQRIQPKATAEHQRQCLSGLLEILDAEQ